MFVSMVHTPLSTAVLSFPLVRKQIPRQHHHIAVFSTGTAILYSLYNQVSTIFVTLSLPIRWQDSERE